MATPPSFATRTVARALKVPVSTLNQWFGAGHLDGLDCAQTTQGVERHYSFEDACSVALFQVLTRLGVAPAAAGWLMQTAIDAADLGHARRLEYREYPDDPKGHVTLDGQDVRPGALLLLTVDLPVLFTATAARLRAALAADAGAHVPAG